MKITVQSSKVVTPSCSGGRPSGDPEAVPLTVFDKVNYDLYAYGLYFFRPPAPRSSVLEAGLGAALAEYPEWAGRLGFDARGNRAILLNGAGACFVEATADVPLDSVMPLQPATSETLSLHPSGEDDDAVDVDGELMLVQVTRFTCGSFVVGTAAQHLVADGLAFRSFVNAWGQATRGAAIDPVPVHDRVSFFVRRDPPRVEFEHRGAEYKQPRTETQAGSRKSRSNVDDKVVMHSVNFSREFVAELKKRASAGAPGPYSTLQCVAAHLWRCVTKARRLDGCTGTELRISVNGRARMHHPRVPEGYTGNVVLWARTTTTAGYLVRRPLREVVEVVSKAVAAMDDAYFRSFIDFASSGVVEEEGLVPTAEVDPSETMLSPNVQVQSLPGLPFQDFDFGCGPPFFFMPSYPPVEGVIFIVSSFSGDGSVDAYVPLFSQAMDIFKNSCHSLSAADARL
ncbi:agmatine coumaroyltransferase-2-like [Miscanthus floridulus]|uniref:agmatine coumaroyltransferase-2-like n=1 Tax=Miscanthus floridulus TaxID=154761 RepID=UPI00345A0B4A